MKVYSVGYTDLQAPRVVESLMGNPSTLLIDTRYSPNSRRPEWSKRALEQKYGARYRWAGQYLGNVNYQQKGSIKLADPEAGISGLRMFLAKGYDLILLCACKEYEQCHRKTVIELLQQQEPMVVVEHPLTEAIPGLRALSILQPYTMMLANPGLLESAGVPAKRVENRSWSTRYRGPLLLHASKRFDQEALPFWVRRFPALAGVMPSNRDGYELGGIVGVADLVDVVEERADPWFCGKYGLVLANARSLPFIPCSGQPSLFSVSSGLLEGVK